MDLLSTFFIAVALAMDAFAVSMAVGMGLKHLDFRPQFRLAWHFGFFQAAMTTLGWALGTGLRELLARIDHWIAFFCLLAVGSHMIVEGVRGHHECSAARDLTQGGALVMLSVATSIDAFAVGLGLTLLGVSILLPVLIIGTVAGSFTLIGMHLGYGLGARMRLDRWAEICGGAVLLLIGAHILYRHLTGG